MFESVRNRIIAIWVAVAGFLVPTVAMADPVDYTDMTSVVTAMTAQLNTTTVLTVIVGGITLSIGFVFLWWGIRYVWDRLHSSSKGHNMRP